MYSGRNVKAFGPPGVTAAAMLNAYISVVHPNSSRASGSCRSAKEIFSHGYANSLSCFWEIMTGDGPTACHCLIGTFFALNFSNISRCLGLCTSINSNGYPLGRLYVAHSGGARMKT